MEEELGITFSLRYFLFPRNNRWLKRILLVFSFISFDYLITLTFCQHPSQEANLYARGFMNMLGIPLGLTLFVLSANLPIYMTLSLDSHIVTFSPKISMFTETLVDLIFAWFVAGLHFSGGTSWLWCTSPLTRQSLGTLLYLVLAVLVFKPYKTRQIDSEPCAETAT